VLGIEVDETAEPVGRLSLAEPETERTTALGPRWVELELTGMDSPTPKPTPRAAGTDVEALLAAERARYERRLAQKVGELRQVARRRAKEVLNRRMAELRGRVHARMQELRAERKALEAQLRAGESARAALAAERQALAQERAALEAERAAFTLERAARKGSVSRRAGKAAAVAEPLAIRFDA
jgi:hypothetical protein